MKLPPYKKFNWRIMARNYKPYIIMLVVFLVYVVVVAVLMAFIDERTYRINADDSRIAAEEHAHIMNHARHAFPMGAPGTTATDIREDTSFVSELRRVR